MTATFTKDVSFDVEIEYTIKATSDVVCFDSKNKRTKKVTFSGKKLDNCLNVYRYAVGFDLTIEQMLEVVFSSDQAFEDFCQVREYPDSTAKEIFCRAFGEFILKDDRHHWPVGGDPEDYTNKFFNDLNETAVELGYVKIPS
jgi:hypothetical protein